MFTRTVYALGQAQGAQPASGPMSMFLQFAPLVLIFGVFYFLIIRPQQKKSKTQQEFLNQLKKGDKITTIGGIIGTVVGIKENNIVTIEIASGVKIDVLKKAIASAQDEPSVAA